MKSRLVKGIEVQRGSGNVYAGLDWRKAEKLKIKSGLGDRDQEGHAQPESDAAGMIGDPPSAHSSMTVAALPVSSSTAWARPKTQ